jgi:hypothetical protein
MRLFSSGFFKIVTFVFVALTVTLTLPRFSPVLFVSLPGPSPSFDCDDATLAMYRHFQSLGIESTPIVGNLDMAGEEYEKSNHVWLLVKSGEKEIAYDWGLPRFDSQHYEGYTISLDYLLYAVAEDRESDDAIVIAER